MDGDGSSGASDRVEIDGDGSGDDVSGSGEDRTVGGSGERSVMESSSGGEEDEEK